MKVDLIHRSSAATRYLCPAACACSYFLKINLFAFLSLLFLFDVTNKVDRTCIVRTESVRTEGGQKVCTVRTVPGSAHYS